MPKDAYTWNGTTPESAEVAELADVTGAVDAHTTDTTDTHAASAITFTPDGSIAATNVQDAIVEVRDEAGAGAHPDLAAHDALGLATQAELDAHTTDTVAAHAASAIAFTPNGSIAATDVQAAIQEVRDEAGGGGAPTTANYLVGTADAGLSAEIVVGTSPGGELGGTWASPTVDATHSGSTHSAATDAHIADTSSAHSAASISVTDVGGLLAATDVEAALAEITNRLPRYVHKTSAQSVTSSTTLQADNQLSFLADANSVYVFKFFIWYEALALGDFKGELQASTTYDTFHWTLPGNATGATGIVIGAVGDYEQSGFVRDLEGFGAGVSINAIFEGIIDTNANACNVRLWWAQNTSSMTATKVLTGSYVEYRKIG